METDGLMLSSPPYSEYNPDYRQNKKENTNNNKK